MLLNNRNVFVTGGSKGIGRAIALKCAEHGANVAISAEDSPESRGALAATAEAIAAHGVKSAWIAAPAEDPETGQRLVDTAVRAFGRLDTFINNAGICPFHSFLDMPRETYQKTVDVNLNGAFFAVQAAANQMVAQGEGGAIVAVSSISALVGGGMQTHYTPTKAGVLSLMQSTAVALGPHGIRCNALLPGTIETDINRADLADTDKRSYMESRTPLGRLGAPDDLAGPAVFLASDLAQYVTGAALLVDGGLFVNLQ
ncbi:SDR family NAD(P)-dependent oxidoreductase [Salinisphaera sp. Q1T1-3]|uniref:SDR family NAD(P)-dependent oxidoreductase n=1 Tax=Salinisphaera sp. Q1T1-3 TaxID=2321229 RepID=UPI000E7713A8|nr:SDR family NAD(P)-dependent oxidoreductase [Salinisphaera sp. Q1T1-3]RJS93767.1 SDR family oxidoreductase [Salinisphaera sp. Q1T1-3]